MPETKKRGTLRGVLMIKCKTGYCVIALGLYEDRDSDLIEAIERIQQQFSPEDRAYQLSETLCDLIRKGLNQEATA